MEGSICESSTILLNRFAPKIAFFRLVVGMVFPSSSYFLGFFLGPHERQYSLQNCHALLFIIG